MPAAVALAKEADLPKASGGVTKRVRYVSKSTAKTIERGRLTEERRTCLRLSFWPTRNDFKPTSPFFLDEDENVWEVDYPNDNMTSDEWMKLRAMTSCFEDQGVDFAMSEDTYMKLCDRKRKVCYFCAAKVADAPWLVLRGDTGASSAESTSPGWQPPSSSPSRDTEESVSSSAGGAAEVETSTVYKVNDVDIACGTCWFKAKGRSRGEFIAHALASAEPWSDGYYGDIATAQAIKALTKKEVVRARGHPANLTLKVTDAEMRGWQTSAYCSLCGAPPLKYYSEGLTRVQFPSAVPAGSTVTMNDVEARCSRCFNFFSRAGDTESITLGCDLIFRHNFFEKKEATARKAEEFLNEVDYTPPGGEGLSAVMRKDDEFACDTMAEDFFLRLLREDDCSADSCAGICGKVHGDVPEGAEADAAFLHSLQFSPCATPEACPLSPRVLADTYGNRERYPTSRVEKSNALLPWSRQNIKVTCRGCSLEEGAPFDDYVTYLKQSVESRGKAFDLPRDTFDSMRRKRCDYCGRLPSALRLNGIDRVVNSQGYVEGNCVPCCVRCNRWKYTRSASKFLAQCASVGSHHATFPNWFVRREGVSSSESSD